MGYPLSRSPSHHMSQQLFLSSPNAPDADCNVFYRWRQFIGNPSRRTSQRKSPLLPPTVTSSIVGVQHHEKPSNGELSCLLPPTSSTAAADLQEVLFEKHLNRGFPPPTPSTVGVDLQEGLFREYLNGRLPSKSPSTVGPELQKALLGTF